MRGGYVLLGIHFGGVVGVRGKGTGYQCNMPGREVRVVGYRRTLAGGVKYKGWLQRAVDGCSLARPSGGHRSQPLFPLAWNITFTPSAACAALEAVSILSCCNRHTYRSA